MTQDRKKKQISEQGYKAEKKKKQKKKKIAKNFLKSMQILIQKSTALCRAAQTWNFVLLEREMIICKEFFFLSMFSRLREMNERTICDFITQFNLLFRINDNLLLTTYRDDFGSAVRVTRMID